MPTTAEIIARLGFPDTKGFQTAWNLGTALDVDGIIGPYTSVAAMKSWDRHEHGLADLSAHFSAREFRCHCGGRLAGCAKLKVHRKLLSSLEKYRAKYSPRGVVIVSGYRCTKRNKSVGGAPGSMHRYGLAADIYGDIAYSALKSQHWFAGYGIASDGDVVHVDRRDVRGTATLLSPDRWWY
jgi:hypothetical protein